MLIVGRKGVAGMRKVWAGWLSGRLPREGGDEDPVVVHQHERSILLHQDVVRLEVTMCEGLGE